jgi:hypothetical protein
VNQRFRREVQLALDMRTALGEKGTAAESRAALAALSLEEGQAATAEAMAREAIAVFEAEKPAAQASIADR